MLDAYLYIRPDTLSYSGVLPVQLVIAGGCHLGPSFVPPGSCRVLPPAAVIWKAADANLGSSGLESSSWVVRTKAADWRVPMV